VAVISVMTRGSVDGLEFGRVLGEDRATMDHTPKSPFVFFEGCFAKAKALKLPHADSMVLITATPEAKPSGRIVLLKGVIPGTGFRFYTNYESRKSLELAENPQAQLLFYWEPFGRQIRIEGKVHRLSEKDSDEYWFSRPRGSRIGALASDQSRPLDSMDSLRKKAARLEQEYEGREVNRPAHWGGFELVADYFEFWEDRPDRLHERITYTKAGAEWKIGRLNP
jgi:pyridoxamine 5'-phosphate oxidase